MAVPGPAGTAPGVGALPPAPQEPGTPALTARTTRTARNAAVSAAAQVAGKVATLGWTVVAARVLAPEQFGAFFFALTLGLLLSALAGWGFDPVMVQRASRDRSLLPALYTRSLTWQAGLAVPLFALAGAVACLARPSTDSRVAVALVLPAVLLDMWGETLRATAASVQHQFGTAKALVLQRVATVVLVLAALGAGLGLVGLCVAFLGGSAVGLAAHLRAVSGLGVRLEPAAVRRAPMLDLLRASGVIGLTSVVLMALFRLDTLLLGALDGDLAVASYAAAYKLLETVLFVAFALRSAVFPVLASSDDRDLVRRGTETALSAAAVVYLPFGLVCLVEARPLLHLLYGEPYASASTAVLQWLALAPMAYAVAFLANAALQAVHRVRVMLWGAVAATVANVLLNLVLIPQHGGTGAAVATTASYLLESVIVVLALRRAGVGLRLGRPLMESAIASAAMVAVLVGLPLPLLLEVPVAGVVYLAVWAGLAHRHSPEQLQVLRSLVKR